MSRLIDRFVETYKDSLAVHEQVASEAEQRCRSLLEEHNIQAVVTSRAKCPTRLREKLVKRNPELQYHTEADIRSNIPDLSGVRIALYLPSQQEDVIRLLQQMFIPILVKVYDSIPTTEHNPHHTRRANAAYLPPDWIPRRALAHVCQGRQPISKAESGCGSGGVRDPDHHFAHACLVRSRS